MLRLRPPTPAGRREGRGGFGGPGPPFKAIGVCGRLAMEEEMLLLRRAPCFLVFVCSPKNMYLCVVCSCFFTEARG